MDDKIVLICATGRSGSTSLQRIINTIPNSNICGENNGAVNSLLEFYMKLHMSSKNNILGHYNPAKYEDIINKGIKPAWYNSYNMTEMEEHIRKTIVSMFKKDATTNVWGFKEIRYDGGKINLIKFFKYLFPKTKVIIQIRENLVAQSMSGWHKNNKGSKQFLTEVNNELVEFYNKNNEWCFLTSFERMFDKNNLKNIFNFIDCRDNYDEAKVTKVLQNNLKD